MTEQQKNEDRGAQETGRGSHAASQNKSAKGQKKQQRKGHAKGKAQDAAAQKQSGAKSKKSDKPAKKKDAAKKSKDAKGTKDVENGNAAKQAASGKKTAQNTRKASDGKAGEKAENGNHRGGRRRRTQYRRHVNLEQKRPELSRGAAAGNGENLASCAPPQPHRSRPSSFHEPGKGSGCRAEGHPAGRPGRYRQEHDRVRMRRRHRARRCRLYVPGRQPSRYRPESCRTIRTCSRTPRNCAAS